MGILSAVNRNLVSNSKSLNSLSNFWFIRRISSPAAAAAAVHSKLVQQSSPHAPKSNNNNNKLTTMLLIEHLHNVSGKPEPSYLRNIRSPPYNYSLISLAENKSWKDHHNLCKNPLSELGEYYLAASCNELMMLLFDKSDPKGDRIALWSPTINKIIKILPQSHLPAPPPEGPLPATVVSKTTRAFAFGFDPESEDYKVLRYIIFGYDDGSDTYCSPHGELYSLKTNSWKKITSLPCEPLEKSSVHVNSAYYWVDFNLPRDRILSFDFAKENFSCIPLLPEFDEHNKELFGKLLVKDFVLVEFDGSVAALVHSELSKSITEEEKPFSFEVWGWNGESWLEKVPTTTIDVPGGVFSVQGLFQDDKLFLQGFKNGELMLFDLANNKLENLGIHADPYYMDIFPYVSVPFGKKSMLGV